MPRSLVLERLRDSATLCRIDIKALTMESGDNIAEHFATVYVEQIGQLEMNLLELISWLEETLV